MSYQSDTRDVVVVGASAGGVDALISLFTHLPSDVAAAFLVVLHIPPESASQLASILGRSTTLPVKSAIDGEAVIPGQVYVASADRHLMLQDDRVRITRGPRESRSRPSVDVLFRSAAFALGPRVIAVVLSGALDDGTAGAWAVKDRGGVVIAQQPSEAMYPSMPESVIEHVDVDHVGTTQQLAQVIAGLVGSPAPFQSPSVLDPNMAVETLIAMEGNGLKAGVMNLGNPSKYTCPDCHGVLVEITEGSIVRFRCHTGHAFSLMTLLAEVNESIDKGLWETLRAFEERVMLLRQMEALAHTRRHMTEAARWKQQADAMEHRIKPLREMVLDPKFFGHDKTTV
jgi:two-component system chemotaxis response regulator CheB